MQTPLKTCSRCGTDKPLDEFALRMSTKKGLVPKAWCMACETPQLPTAEANRRKLLMKRYKLTVAEFTAMGEKQEWLCAICSDDISAKPYVDHDHITGNVRALLCTHCNLGLGHFRDSVDNLLNAIYYLERGGKPSAEQTT